MKAETARQRVIMKALSTVKRKLFRNNVGVAVYTNNDGEKRRVIYGLCKGSSDTIGWETITITPAMVGKEVAVFLAIEIKVDGDPTKDQKNFIRVVNESGGIAGVARTVEEARQVIRNGLSKFTNKK